MVCLWGGSFTHHLKQMSFIYDSELYWDRISTEAHEESASALRENARGQKDADVPPFISPGLMREGGHGHAAAPC